MITRQRLCIACLASAMALSAVAPAQETATIHTRYNLSVASSANMERIPPRKGLSQDDRKFIAAMALVHIAEIKFGRLAVQNGADWAHGYGVDLVREHTLALEQLGQVAQNNGVALPKDASLDMKKAIDKLESLHGAAFDAAFRNMMIAGHKQVLGIVRDEIRYGRDSDVRGLAVIEEAGVNYHLRMAEQQTTMLGTREG